MRKGLAFLLAASSLSVGAGLVSKIFVDSWNPMHLVMHRPAHHAIGSQDSGKTQKNSFYPDYSEKNRVATATYVYSNRQLENERRIPAIVYALKIYDTNSNDALHSFKQQNEQLEDFLRKLNFNVVEVYFPDDKGDFNEPLMKIFRDGDTAYIHSLNYSGSTFQQEILHWTNDLFQNQIDLMAESYASTLLGVLRNFDNNRAKRPK